MEILQPSALRLDFALPLLHQKKYNALILIIIYKYYFQPLSVGDTCSQCQQIVGLVEAWIASAATQQEIVQMLEAVCSAIPALEQIVPMKYI
jgi:hypothetical protein